LQNFQLQRKFLSFLCQNLSNFKMFQGQQLRSYFIINQTIANAYMKDKCLMIIKLKFKFIDKWLTGITVINKGTMANVFEQICCVFF